MAAQYKVLNAMRHTDAQLAARDAGVVDSFDSLLGARHCLLISYKRSGEPVPTPVNCAISPDGVLYFRTEPDVGKMKRIKLNPSVTVCASTLRGRPTGPVIKGVAALVPRSDEARVHGLLSSNWDLFSRPLERFFDLMRVPIVYVEVRPIG